MPKSWDHLTSEHHCVKQLTKHLETMRTPLRVDPKVVQPYGGIGFPGGRRQSPSRVPALASTQVQALIGKRGAQNKCRVLNRQPINLMLPNKQIVKFIAVAISAQVGTLTQARRCEHAAARAFSLAGWATPSPSGGVRASPRAGAGRLDCRPVLEWRWCHSSISRANTPLHRPRVQWRDF